MEEHMEQLLADVGLLIKDGRYLDVSVVCSNQVVMVNSLLLASASPFLASALSQLPAGEDMVVVMPDTICAHDVSVFFESVCDWNWEKDELHTPDTERSLLKMLDVLGVDLKSIPAARKSESQPEEDGIKTLCCCPVCDATFSQAKLLKRHLRTVHSDSNPYTCEICCRRCRGPAELDVHKRIHTKEKPFPCDQCGKAFAQKSQVNDHLNKVHYSKNKAGANMCQICSLILASQPAVRRHQKIHARPEIKETAALDSSDDDDDDDDDDDQGEEEDEGGDGRFFCDHPNCNKSFKNCNLLKVHGVVHSGNKAFQCDVCKKFFSQKSHLTVHKAVHSGVKPHMCTYCGKQFSVKSNMKKHLRIHETNAAELQGACDAKTLLPAEDERGEVLVVERPIAPLSLPAANPDRHECPNCGLCSGSLAELRTHSDTCGPAEDLQSAVTNAGSAGDSGLFQCSYCPASFKFKSSCKIHEKEHTGRQKLTCKVCHLACVSKSDLRKHELIHTGQKPHVCSQCGKCFVQKSQLNYHQRMVHNEVSAATVTEKSCVCFECGACFRSSSGMTKHLRIHTNQRPFVCDQCGASFVQKTHLSTHMLKHSGKPTHCCTQCGKSFQTKSNLKEHAKSHCESRQYLACDFADCKAKYLNLSDLKVHQRKHTGERPFMCGVCHKSFRSNRLLKDHSRIHVAEKPFLCKNCSKTFTTASGLKQHFKRHDTCKLSALSSSYSFAANPVIMESEQLEFTLLQQI